MNHVAKLAEEEDVEDVLKAFRVYRLMQQARAQ
jgi:hypothetical protein